MSTSEFPLASDAAEPGIVANRVGTAEAARRRRVRAVAGGLAIFGICLAGYLSTGRIVRLEEGWDSLPTRVLPFSILMDGTLTLDAFSAEFSHDTREIGYLEQRRNHLVSHYAIGAAIVAVPFDIPVCAALRLQGKTSPHEIFETAEKTERFTAGIISALAVLVLYTILAGWAGSSRAAAVSLVFGLGTSMWATASQQLWQHGPDVLCLLLGIFFLSRARLRPLSLVLGGFFLGLMFGIRPAAAIYSAAGFAYAIWRENRLRDRLRSGAAFAAGASAAIAPFLLYNGYYFGNLIGGPTHAVGKLSVGNLPAGFLGLILSPNRGLLVFTPIAIVGIAGMAIGFRQARARPLLATFSAAAVLYALVHSSFTNWTGGWTFGPRYLIEVLPIFALASILAIRRMNRRWILASTFLAIWSLAVQLDGAFCFGASRWESRIGGPLEARAWDWRHLELWEDFIVRTSLFRYKIVAEPMPSSGFRVRWGPVRLPDLVERGRPIVATVRFQNVSQLSWLDPNSANLGGDEAVHAVRLSSRWLEPDSDTIVTEYAGRSDLEVPLAPGEWASLSMSVTPPEKPGEYRLQFDLVQERVAWFERRGADRLILPIHVR